MTASSIVLRPSSFVLSGYLASRAEPGETVAIVGQTGSGKTTLTKLVNRIYDATAGRVLIDGVDVRDWSMDSRCARRSRRSSRISSCSRARSARTLPLARPARPPASRSSRPRKAAQAHEFILGFPDGYDTVVGERGVTLSGGQRQRIAIARAFLTDPRILILDDSTSAIDSATEDQIQRAMRRIMKGRTTLLITHRLSQIRWADRILVLRERRAGRAGHARGAAGDQRGVPTDFCTVRERECRSQNSGARSCTVMTELAKLA